MKAEKWIGKTYAPDLMVKEAREFIASNKSKPFFLYLAFTEPHMAIHPPLDRLDEYPKDWDTKPYRGEGGYLPHPRPRAAYAAMISDLDRHVGAVREALDKAGVLDETLVIFTSDNGATHDAGGVDTKFFHSVGDLNGRKGSVYEGGLRVPTIVRLPGKLKAGAENTTPGFFPDWFPTLCAAAGLRAPDGLDGINLWPGLTSDAAVERAKPMLWVFPEYGGQVAVRLGDFKVMRRNLNAKKPGPWLVFDLAKDPNETTDVSAAHPELIEKAAEILKREASPNEIFPVKIPDAGA